MYSRCCSLSFFVLDQPHQPIRRTGRAQMSVLKAIPSARLILGQLL